LGTVKPRGGEDPLTWTRLKELMDRPYYPKDVQRMKEREVLGLKQGNLSVMEYACKFNELSRFVPHQVSTEERRMDHFAQGLKGRIWSMIAGHTFDHFQDMYQRAVKIARVLDESENESHALSQGKRKMEPFRGGFRGGSNKQYKPN